MSNSYFLDDDLFEYLEDTSSKITNKTTERIVLKKDNDGCFCRSCGEFYRFAEPDKVINDNKMTCWRCGTHIFRKYKGLPDDKVREIDLIYKK